MRIAEALAENGRNGKVQETRPAKRFVIVGLGNPGAAYARHRHNLGFMVVDALAAEARGLWRKDRQKAKICEISIEDKEATLIKPQTYMNLSGVAVAPLLKRFRSSPAQMVVIHDDLDLSPGSVRIKFGGGDGGHRGIRSIADSLGTKDFARVRLGIGRPPAGIDPEEFVLSPFDLETEEGVRELVSTGSRAVKLIVTLGLEPARNLIHSGRLSPASGPS